MLKNMLKLGTALGKKEQQTINGGNEHCMFMGRCLRLSMNCTEAECRCIID